MLFLLMKFFKNNNEYWCEDKELRYRIPLHLREGLDFQNTDRHCPDRGLLKFEKNKIEQKLYNIDGYDIHSYEEYGIIALKDGFPLCVIDSEFEMHKRRSFANYRETIFCFEGCPKFIPFHLFWSKFGKECRVAVLSSYIPPNSLWAYEDVIKQSLNRGLYVAEVDEDKKIAKYLYSRNNDTPNITAPFSQNKFYICGEEMLRNKILKYKKFKRGQKSEEI